MDYLDGEGRVGGGVGLVHEGVVGEHHHVGLDRSSLLLLRLQRWTLDRIQNRPPNALGLHQTETVSSCIKTEIVLVWPLMRKIMMLLSRINIYSLSMGWVIRHSSTNVVPITGPPH